MEEQNGIFATTILTHSFPQGRFGPKPVLALPSQQK